MELTRIKCAELILAFMTVGLTVGGSDARIEKARHKHAYAAMMYMGTPRDYEFYVATRVMLRSLATLRAAADLVVIASADVPPAWIRALEHEDGAKIVKVDNLDNPYKHQDNFNQRFKLSLNKIYAWSLSKYERVVMLDSDNLFLQKTDELFQCGEFCAVFINPCIFHTGLFVLEPSVAVFKSMLHDLETARENADGADQGFFGGYFKNLLDQPMFNPLTNGSKLQGTYRLPLGYQMDASYYYLKLRWSIPCGPNSVITFPGALWLKPWYWWSWPVLPLGLLWHEKRQQTIGYGAEMLSGLILIVTYVGVIISARFVRPILSKLCHRRPEKGMSCTHGSSLKLFALWSILTAYIVPFFVIPYTIHPLIGWGLYLLGSFALSSITINAFLLPAMSVLTPWFGILGVLLVMAFPLYSDGVVRALAVFGYSFCYAPVVWVSLVKILSSLQMSLEREVFLPRLGEPAVLSPEFKLY